MAEFKPIKCLSSQLNFIPIKEGQFICTTDNGKIYLDIDFLNRIECINNTINKPYEINIYSLTNGSSLYNIDTIYGNTSNELRTNLVSVIGPKFFLQTDDSILIRGDIDKIENWSESFAYGSYYRGKKLNNTIMDFSKIIPTDISRMFESSQFDSNIPNFDTSKVTNMANFCYNSTFNGTVPDFNYYNVTNTYQAFANCKNISTINAPPAVGTTLNHIGIWSMPKLINGYHMFKNTSLTRTAILSVLTMAPRYNQLIDSPTTNILDYFGLDIPNAKNDMLIDIIWLAYINQLVAQGWGAEVRDYITGLLGS